MRTIRSAPPKSTAAQRIAHEEPRRVLLVGVHRVLEIEDHGVRRGAGRR